VWWLQLRSALRAHRQIPIHEIDEERMP
jgi:hypothetical protein